MPYKSNTELPSQVAALPDRAKTIWRKAYNSAFDQYDGDESKSAATAWSTVKNKYVQRGEKWVLKDGILDRLLAVFKKPESLDDQRNAVSDAWYSTVAKPVPELSSWPVETYADHIIVRANDGTGHLKVPYTRTADGEVTFDMDAATEVERVWQEMSAKTAVAKIDEPDADRGWVFGWASVVVDKGEAEPIQDLQGDRLDIENVEEVAYDFVKRYSEVGSNDMHDGPITGQLIESMVFTPEKIERLATDPTTGEINEEARDALTKYLPQGWWNGYEIDRTTDEGAEQWKLVKEGDRPMFSIEGMGDRTFTEKDGQPATKDVLSSALQTLQEALEEIGDLEDQEVTADA